MYDAGDIQLVGGAYAKADKIVTRPICLAVQAGLSEGERRRVATVRRAHDAGRMADAGQLAAGLPPAATFPS